MAKPDVLDLDILRPKKRIVKIGGKEIDAGFIPLAITWDVDKLVQELSSFDEEKLRTESRRALELSCEFCSVFCHEHPDMTPDWFMENTSALQINAFVSVIKDTLTEAYNGIEAYPGNA